MMGITGCESILKFILVIINNNSIFDIMNESLKIKIRESGFKINFLASKISVQPNYLSMCLNGERMLSEDKVKILKDFLYAIPA
jgi:plasmid maintenance system antidote protein VapI